MIIVIVSPQKNSIYKPYHEPNHFYKTWLKPQGCLLFFYLSFDFRPPFHDLF